MKKEIDKNIFEATLCYLNDSVDLYRQFSSAAKSEKLKKAYENHIQDINEINAVFLDSFKPKRKHTTEGEQNYAR